MFQAWGFLCFPRSKGPWEPPLVFFPTGNGSSPTLSSHCDGRDRALWGRQLALPGRLKQ